MKKSLSDEDKALFEAYTKGVQPIGQPKRMTPHQKVPEELRTLDLYFSEYHLLSSEATLSYKSQSLQNKRFHALKTRKLSIEATLDLHGVKSDRLDKHLQIFIQHAKRPYQRAVLIIHGKGGHDCKPPILKNKVYQYLKQLPDVLAFHSALPKDGGVGALYVLLKRDLKDSP